MQPDIRPKVGDGSDGSAPSESWLFAQMILGNPIPRIVNPEVSARREREELEQLARSSPAHADKLRRLRATEADGRREREVLEWAAKFSADAAAGLQKLLWQEAEEREAWRRAEQFYEAYLAEGPKWVEGDHPRQPKGAPEGGQWVSKTGRSGAAKSSAPAKVQAAAAPVVVTKEQLPADSRGNWISGTRGNGTFRYNDSA
jgi:hypothetical protein